MDILSCRPFEKYERAIENKRGKNFSQNIFYVAFAVLLLLYGALFSLTPEFPEKVEGILSKMRYAVCAVFIFRGTLLCARTLRQLLVMGGVLAFCFVTSLKGHDATLFISFCTIYAAKGASFKTAGKITFFGSAAVITVVLLLGMLGILPDYELYRTDDVVRYSLGFAHPNAFGLWLMSACFAFCSGFKDKLKLQHFALMLLAGGAMFYFTNSRASFLCIAAAASAVPLCAALLRKERTGRAFSRICAACIVLMCAFSIWSALFYNDSLPELMLKLNKAFSNRMLLSKEAYKLYGTSFFGSGAFAEDPSVVVDNLYTRIFITSGTPAMLLFTYAQVVSCLNAAKKKLYGGCLLSFLWAAYSTMEIFGYVAVLNVTLLLFSASDTDRCFEKNQPDR